MLPLPDNRGLLLTPKETHDLNLSSVTLSICLFRNPTSIFETKNCTILVCLHSFLLSSHPFLPRVEENIKNKRKWWRTGRNRVQFWFLVCHGYTATQLAIQLHQGRIQVVRSNREVRKAPTESNSTHAMDLGFEVIRICRYTNKREIKQNWHVTTCISETRRRGGRG